jgi:hypothetical protein
MELEYGRNGRRSARKCEAIERFRRLLSVCDHCKLLLRVVVQHCALIFGFVGSL